MAEATYSTTKTKIDHAAVMKDAWLSYRTCNRGRAFDRRAFAYSLGCAWDRARRAIMTTIERQKVAIHVRIEGLKYRPLRIDVTRVERALRAELEALA